MIRTASVARLAATTLSLGLMVSVMGCAKDDQTASTPTTVAEKPTTGGPFVFGIPADPNGFDPSRNPFTPAAWMVIKAVVDPLAVVGVDGKPMPYLAESFSSNEAFTEWKIKIRPNVTFHDKAKLDAQAVADNLGDRKKQIVTTGAMVGVAEGGIKVVDPLTVSVTMTQPWANFPLLLTGQVGYMISPQTFKDDATRKVGEYPVGSGPFMFEEGSWARNQHVKVKRNPDYWQKDGDGTQLPYLDEVTFKISTDPSTRVSELQKGDVNAFTATGPDIATKFLADPIEGIGTAIDRTDGAELFISLTNAKGPFADKNLRVAAAAAIDRDAMNKELFNGVFEVANGPTAKGSPWGDSSTYPAYDPEKAKQLVSAASGGAKVPVTLSIVDSTENQAVALYVKEQWDKVGFDTTIEPLTETPFAIKVVSASADALAFTFFYDGDPDAMWHFMTPKNSPASGQVAINFSRWKSPAAEKALDEARATTDQEKRKAEYKTLWDEMGKDVPYLFLFHVPGTVAWGKNVRGIDTLTLPDGSQAKPFIWSTGFLTRTWIKR